MAFLRWVSAAASIADRRPATADRSLMVFLPSLLLGTIAPVVAASPDPDFSLAPQGNGGSPAAHPERADSAGRQIMRRKRQDWWRMDALDTSMWTNL
jgi:hypothetical protein